MAKRRRIPRDGAPASPPPRDDTAPGPHQVVNAGEGGGFGVTSRDGGLEPQWFDSRKAAEDFARAQRKFFEGLDRAAAEAASKAGAEAAAAVSGPATGPSFPASMAAALASRSPGRGPAVPPPPTPAGAWPAGMGPPPASWFPGGMYPQPTSFGPGFPAGPGGFPVGMAGGYRPPPLPPPPAPPAPAGPVAPPSPWPAGMASALSPGPRSTAAPTPAGAWPAGMGPAPTPQWPAGMAPAAPAFGPNLPAGPGGFPAGMAPGGYQPPPPPQPKWKDIFRDLGKDLLAAVSQNGPGRFDWTKIGEALGKGVTKAGPLLAAAGLPGVPEALELLKQGNRAMTERFSRAAGFLDDSREAGLDAIGVNAGNRRLAHYSGAVAAGFGQLDFGDFRRTYELAQATAGTTATLARSVDGMKDSWFAVDVLGTDLANRRAIYGAARSGVTGDVLSIPAGLANWALGAVDPGGVSSTAAGKARGYFDFGRLGATVGGSLLPGPLGSILGGILGAGGAAVADVARPDPKGAVDPWGTFLSEVGSAKPLRPARPVTTF